MCASIFYILDQNDLREPNQTISCTELKTTFPYVDIETVNSDSNETDNTDDLCKQSVMPFPASLMDMLKHPRTSHIDYLLMDPDANLLHCAKTIQDFNLLE